MKTGPWGRIASWWLTLRAASHRHFGNAYADRDSYENAIADLTYAIQLNPDKAEAYVMRGTLYWRELNDPQRAVRDLDRALELAPTYWEALLNRGFAHQAAGEWELALSDLRRYAADAPVSSWTSTAEYVCRQLEQLLSEQKEPATDQK